MKCMTMEVVSMTLILLFAYPIVDLFIVAGAIMYYFRGRSISLNKENTVLDIHFLLWVFLFYSRFNIWI